MYIFPYLVYLLQKNKVVKVLSLLFVLNKSPWEKCEVAPLMKKSLWKLCLCWSLPPLTHPSQFVLNFKPLEKTGWGWEAKGERRGEWKFRGFPGYSAKYLLSYKVQEDQESPEDGIKIANANRALSAETAENIKRLNWWSGTRGEQTRSAHTCKQLKEEAEGCLRWMTWR